MPKLIQEAKRFQKLAGIITEQNNQQSAPAAMSQQDSNAINQGLQAGLAKLQSASRSAKPSQQQPQQPQQNVNESGTAGILAALTGAPGLIQALGQGIDLVANSFRSIENIKPTMLGSWLQKFGHNLEKTYVDSIAGWLQTTNPAKYKGQNSHDQKSELFKHAHGIYAGFLAAAAVASGEAAADEAADIMTRTVEGGLSAFKAGEVQMIASKLTSI